MRPATRDEQQYLDHAFRYAERAVVCYSHELWPEAATNFGSALESLLRVRFGSGGKLFGLVEKFDKDPLFDEIFMHEGSTKRCSTCVVDQVRKLRNAVHPDCWREATKKEVDQAGLLVLMLYHVLVQCDCTRIAAFQIPREAALSRMEDSGFRPASRDSVGHDLP